MSDDKSGLAAQMERMRVLLAWERRLAKTLVNEIRFRVPSCGVVPVDQRERLKSERYGQ